MNKSVLPETFEPYLDGETAEYQAHFGVECDFVDRWEASCDLATLDESSFNGSELND